jgi:hypothetical protein
MWWLWLMACEQNSIPEFVQVSGTVFQDRYDTSEIAEGATLRVLDLALEEIDEVETDEEGSFEAQARAGGPLFVELSAEGFVPTSFSGLAGVEDLSVPDHTLWLRSEEDRAELEGEFDGCEGSDEGGGLIEGEVRMFLSTTDGDYSVVVTTAWAVAGDAEGNVYEACYLGEDGTIDPDADMTGASGRFAIFGASGALTLQVGYSLADEPYYSVNYQIYVPEGGVAPFYPAWVEPPLN